MYNSENKAIRNILQRKQFAEDSVLELIESLRENKNFFNAESKYLDISIRYRLMKSELENNGTQSAELAKIENDFKEAEKAFKDVLNELGYDENYSKPKYFCSICNDTGYVNDTDCICLIAEKNRLSKEQINSSITDIDSFDNVSLEKVHKSNVVTLKNAYGLLNKVVMNYPDIKTRIVTLVGPVGCGKTFAASIASNALSKRGFTTLMLPAFKVFDIFKTHTFADIKEKENIISPLESVDVLIIDDLGSEGLVPEFISGYLGQLIFRRSEKLTIITTNYEPEKLEKYGKRFHSRACDTSTCLTLVIKGVDLRIQNKAD